MKPMASDTPGSSVDSFLCAEPRRSFPECESSQAAFAPVGSHRSAIVQLAKPLKPPV